MLFKSFSKLKEQYGFFVWKLFYRTVCDLFVMAFSDVLNSLNPTKPGLLLHLVAAIVILILGFVLGRLLGKLMRKVLHELELDEIIAKHVREGFEAERWISFVVEYATYGFALVWALNQLGITTTVLQIVVALVVFTLVVVVVLTLKDVVKNFFAGLVLRQKSVVKIGKRIEVGLVEGTVVRVGWLETKLVTRKKEVVFVPNSLMVKSVIKEEE